MLSRLCALILILCSPVLAAPLFQIGTPDASYAEFAIAGKYHAFSADAAFVPGRSQPARDWPYIQPGPSDGWAGGRPHTFSIYFALTAAPKDGDCQLTLNLVDAQRPITPVLRVSLNSASVELRPAPGQGDASLEDPKAGNPQKLTAKFPAAALKRGLNQISITTISGCWITYDSLTFDAPEPAKLGDAPAILLGDAQVAPVLKNSPNGPMQPLRLSLINLGKDAEVSLNLEGATLGKFPLHTGANPVELLISPVQTPITQTLAALSPDGKTIASAAIDRRPARNWVVHILPHSHVDIGYTHVQSEVEQLQWRNIDKGIALARKSAAYPPEARFKWNVEVLWPTESYLKQASPEQLAAFEQAVRDGSLGLDALYCNELTGLCRDEELNRLTYFARTLSKRFNTPIDSAMISDVPGYTWGMVPALNRAGVKYFSTGVNYADRIGFALSAWEDKPFYWVGPDGQSKLLVWTPWKGYALHHDPNFRLDPHLLGHLRELDAKGYPYDIVQLRWTTGDNGLPDDQLSNLVRDWNAAYASPKLIISTTSTMFREFEKKYADKIPSFKGDFTPYWEDGAASTAQETKLARNAGERLIQVEALAAMRGDKDTAEIYWPAWRNVILFNEHTWGAHNSISEPDKQFVKDQWARKAQFALDADKQSSELLAKALAGQGQPVKDAVDVINTSSWPRTEVVYIPVDLSTAGDLVKDSAGRSLPSQRLKDGQLAFLATDIPASSRSRFTVSPSPAPSQKQPRPAILDSAAKELDDYFYVPGKDPKSAVPAPAPTVTEIESGPLVYSIRLDSDAPGCNHLTREFRAFAGLDRVEITNTVDKKAVRTKEGVHFRFQLNIANPIVRYDTPFAIAEIEKDQIPGSCKNWFSIHRFVDVSNDTQGQTLVSLDAPLIEVGGITAELPWMDHISPSSTIYSYVMNNYWHTNYKADQSGQVTFRYALQLHGPFNPTTTQHFATEATQPLLVARPPVNP